MTTTATFEQTCPAAALIAEAKRHGYPMIELADGRRLYVDDNGLLHRGRTSLLDPPPESEIQIAARWLRTVTACRSRGTAGGSNSYRLKHVVEEQSGHYLSNGAMIIALHRGGWIQSTGFRSLNTDCNLPARLLDRLVEDQRRKRRHCAA